MDIIIPHISTDLDALGAAVGAQVLYPQAVIVLPGPPTREAGEFISLHRYTLRVRTARDVDLRAVGRVVVVDTADPARLGELKAVADRCEVHVFDHHPPEDGDLPATLAVRDLVGSTCTLLAEIIEESGAAVTPVQATAMLLGIYADTGSLSLTGTTDRDARAAAFLLAHGANLRAMARFLQTGLTPAQHSLLLQLQAHSRVIWLQGVRIRLLEGETRDYVGGLAAVVQEAQEIEPAPALFAAVRMGDRVYLVGRSEVPWVDAAKVMLPFGGGGHPSAASAAIKGLAAHTVLEQVEQTLAQVVERPLLAADVMTGPVKSVLADLPVREAERLMLRYGHSGLPVVDESGHLLGIISLRDAEKARRHGLMHAPVKGMMIRKVYTVTPETPLDAIQALMIERDIGRVPVVAEGNLVGIISRSDLLGLLYGGLPPRWHRTLYATPGPADAADPSEALVRRGLEVLPPELESLLTTAGAVANDMGTTAFAVGGFVRDLLLERPNLDVDIVVEGDGIAYAERLGAALGAVVKPVPRFGTAHLFLAGPRSGAPSRIDIASARREFYEHAAALPVVEHAGLREDLYRRDFSINAMAIRLGNGGSYGLVDFFGGLGDLKAGQIRILHTLSFVEDPTRILRAVRFAHRYSFALDPETADLARRAVTEGFLRRVSAERLRNELLLILQEPGSSGPLAELAALGALPAIVPGLELSEQVRALIDRVDHLDQISNEVPDLAEVAAPWAVKLLVLLRPMEPQAAVAAVTHLRLRREPGQALLHTLATWQTTLTAITAPSVRPSEAVRLLREQAPEGLALLVLLGGGEAVTSYWREWRHVRLAIDGRDLAQAGVPKGPAIGRALARVLAETLDGLAPDRETQLQRALRYANEEA